MNERVKKFECHVAVTSFGRDYRLWLYQDGLGREERRVMSPANFSPVQDQDDGATDVPATLELDRETAQNIVDALIAAGIEPRKGYGTDAHVKAIQAHLEDMRGLALKR